MNQIVPQPKVKALVEYELEDYDGVSPNEAMFIAEYVKSSDATKAFINVYGHADNAKELGQKILRRKKVKEIVNNQIKALSLRILGTDNTVIAELIRCASYNIKDMFNTDGSVKNMSEIPDDLARAITKISFKDITDKINGKTEKIGELVDISFANKGMAIKELMKHKGLVQEATNVGTVNITQIISNQINSMDKKSLNALAKNGLIVDENDLVGERTISDNEFEKMDDLIEAEYEEIKNE